MIYLSSDLNKEWTATTSRNAAQLIITRNFD